MKFFVALSIVIGLGFLGAGWIADSALPARQDVAAVTMGSNAIVSSRADPQRFAIQSQQDAGLNAIRQAAYTAATAYAASPCDTTNKANLVSAFSAYVEAAQIAYGCTMVCSTDEVRAALGAFSTALDTRVKKALALAFKRGGVYSADLPLKTRLAIGYSDPGGSEAQCSGPTRKPPITGRSWTRS